MRHLHIFDDPIILGVTAGVIANIFKELSMIISIMLGGTRIYILPISS